MKGLIQGHVARKWWNCLRALASFRCAPCPVCPAAWASGLSSAILTFGGVAEVEELLPKGLSVLM